jgi:hypothetical protein
MLEIALRVERSLIVESDISAPIVTEVPKLPSLSRKDILSSKKAKGIGELDVEVSSVGFTGWIVRFVLLNFH